MMVFVYTCEGHAKIWMYMKLIREGDANFVTSSVRWCGSGVGLVWVWCGGWSLATPEAVFTRQGATQQAICSNSWKLHTGCVLWWIKINLFCFSSFLLFQCDCSILRRMLAPTQHGSNACSSFLKKSKLFLGHVLENCIKVRLLITKSQKGKTNGVENCL